MSSSIAQLQDQITSLTKLSERVAALRSVPPHLLKPPVYDSLTGNTVYLPNLTQFNEISDTLKSDPIQTALKTARDSQKAADLDAATVLADGRRKRRLSVHAESSPQPFKKSPSPSLKRRTSLFPSHQTEPPLQLSQLPDFLRSFNTNHSSLSKYPMYLKFWKKTRPQDGGPPLDDDEQVILRFVIPDVLTVYISLAADKTQKGQLFVEFVTGFGPREKSSPHSQSDYAVFQAFTQHIAKMLQSDSTVSFQTVMDLLASYHGLFIEKCKCGRVLSAEGHIPPVVRSWLQNEETGQHCWTARHVGCH